MIACGALKDIVRQGYRYTYLAIPRGSHLAWDTKPCNCLSLFCFARSSFLLFFGTVCNGADPIELTLKSGRKSVY